MMDQVSSTNAAVPKSPEQVQGIIAELERLYPAAKYDLNFSTPLELLVATQLAAQCTDARVNSVTGALFRKYRSVEDYATASQEEFEQDIQKITFYRNKAKNIRAACQYILTHHNGEVPRTMAEMVKIPGVARKTANVILSNAFGVTEGVIVDTHVGRLVRRFGWTQHEDPVKVEQELMGLVPREQWLSFAHRTIYHGRAVCDARKPRCADCTLARLCPSAFKAP
ncbi:MAG TPA: endonuclease III [Ktedonosporobacter sp.]|jgi:endonuclease-3|nr:endonuclease III [Ktedonosporobacter sp.]